MLQDIRDNSQGVIAKVIVGLIIAVFALFGVESIIGGFTASPPVAEVNGEEITENQLAVNTQNLLRSIGGSADGFDQDLLEELSLNQLIEQSVMKQIADGSSMTVSDDRLDRSIVETQQFQINGVFDSDLAVRTMASQGFSVSAYRETLREQMQLAQLANAFASSNFITDNELDAVARLTAQTRDLRYLSVTMGSRTLDTPISEEQIQSYYDENQDDFTIDERLVVDYVLLDKVVIAAELDVDEEAVLAQYEQERGEFEGASEKRASHILFEVGSGQSEEQALSAAVAAQARLMDGEDFAALALELSSDTLSAEEGGDIGYSDGSVFPDAIEEALATLSVGEVSEPVVSEFGVHLVKLTEDDSNVYPELSEVRDRIERELKQSEVDLIYGERVADMSNLAFESGDLSALSEQLGLDILRGGPFSNSGGNGVFSNQAVVDAAFSFDVYSEGNNSEVVELNEGQALVLRINEIMPESVESLDDVRGEISVIIRTDLERQAVRDIGAELLAAAQAGTGLEELVAANELEWIEAEAVERNSFTVNRQIVNEAFALAAPEENEVVWGDVILANDTYVLIELQSVTDGSVATLDEARRASMTETMLTDLGNSDLQAVIASLKENSDIRSNTASAQDL